MTSTLVIDPTVQGTGGVYVPEGATSAFADAGYCGRSFNSGLVRFHDSVSGPLYRGHMLTAFPELAQLGIDVLAFDWMGRQVLTRAGTETLLLADPAIGEVGEFFEVGEFSQALRIDAASRAFEGELYAAWRAAVGAGERPIAFTDGVQYAVPLFLGGEASVTNLDLIDLDVMWTITAQLIQRARDAQPGDAFRIESEGGADWT
jgi:hypothetical protein